MPTDCEEPKKDDLWMISAKLKGIGYLLQDQNRAAIPLDQEQADYGVGQIIVDLADRIKEFHERLDGMVSSRDSDDSDD
jgi:hypothetical protein